MEDQIINLLSGQTCSECKFYMRLISSSRWSKEEMGLESDFFCFKMNKQTDLNGSCEEWRDKNA